MDNSGEGTQGTYPRALTHDFLEELGLSIVASNCAPEEARLVLVRDPFHGNYPQVGRLINEVRASEDVVLVEAETEIAGEHYGVALAGNIHSWEHTETYALSMLVDDAQ